MNIFKKIWLLTIVLVFVGQIAKAQHLLTGHVIDSVTRQPVEYATITIEGKSISTNKNGNFRIVLRKDSGVLTVTCIGCKSKTLTCGMTEEHLIIPITRGKIDLKEVVITPQLSGASFHTLSTLDLSLRPVNSSQDLMRLVPGLFIAQHMGGGKAEQIFIRGFDADHGTDLNVSVDGMPVNMVSHIHGQGYADLHFLIPETVSTYDFGKGPYYTCYGDFTTAGYLAYTTKDGLDKSLISIEGGQFHTFRFAGLIDLLGEKAKQNGENAYIAGEYNYTDGPFKLPEHYKRTNFLGKYQLTKLGIEPATFRATVKYATY